MKATIKKPGAKRKSSRPAAAGRSKGAGAVEVPPSMLRRQELVHHRMLDRIVESIRARNGGTPRLRAVIEHRDVEMFLGFVSESGRPRFSSDDAVRRWLMQTFLQKYRFNRADLVDAS